MNRQTPWIWSGETGHLVLRPDPLPPGVADAGFIGRALRPDAPQPVDRARMIRLEQVHGAHLVRAVVPGPVSACDAAFTEVPGLVLTVRTADCLPVLLASTRGVALVHAGWRGLLAGVLDAAVDCFASSEPLTAILGPGIGPCCFEVGPDVARRFPSAVIRSRPQGKPHVDLFAFVEHRLTQLHPRIHLAPPGPCTRCHQHLLYSHRGSAGAPGRILAYAVAAPAVSPR